MADDLFADTSTAVDEPGWGGGGVVDLSGDGMHITAPAERRKHKERSRLRKNKWARAMAIRAETFTEEDYAAEEARIAEEIAEWERRRDAA